METVSDYLVEELARNNINTYFLVTGGAIVPFVDSVGRSDKTEYYCFQNEQSATMAAEGYYRSSGKIACVLVTSGPGVQNTLNGVCGCWYDSIPCLIISGQVNFNESLDSIKSKPRQVGFQEFPVADMFSSVTKYSKKIISVEEVHDVFLNALTAMTSGRMGPVLIDFPVNIQMSKPYTTQSIDISISNVNSTVENLQNIISKSTRPIIVLGNGGRENIKEVEEWISLSQIPFVTSWGACDIIDHTHPLRIGYIGVYGDRCANIALQNADLVIILGSRMDTRETGGNLQLCSRESVKIMVDIDLEEINKLNERGFKIDFPLHSTVKSFILNNPPKKCEYTEWILKVNKWKSIFSIESSRKPGDVYDILSSLHLPDECIIIPDCGGNLVWAMQSIKLSKKQKLFSNFGNSSMGYSLPASIGAAIATNKKIPIICICGDGGIQMNIQELHTVKSLNLPITIIIINNSGYGIIRQFQDQYFKSRYTATSSEEVFGDGIDICKIAAAYGIQSFLSKDIVITDDKPVLYDTVIESSQKIYPKLEFGNSLENMSPFISNIHEHMIVKHVAPIIGTSWVIK